HCVRQHALLAGFALPPDRGLVPPGRGRMAVHAVLCDVDRPADEPPRERRLPLEERRPRPGPIELFRALAPEPLRVLRGVPREPLLPDPGALAERCGWRVLFLLLQQAVDRCARDDHSSITHGPMLVRPMGAVDVSS